MGLGHREEVQCSPSLGKEVTACPSKSLLGMLPWLSEERYRGSLA